MSDEKKLGRSISGEGRVLSIEKYLKRPSVAYVRRNAPGVDREAHWPPGTTGASIEEARLAFIALGRTYGVLFAEAAERFAEIGRTVGTAVAPLLRAFAEQVSDVVESDAFRTWVRICEERDRRKGLVVAYALVAGMALLMGVLALLW